MYIPVKDLNASNGFGEKCKSFAHALMSEYYNVINDIIFKYLFEYYFYSSDFPYLFHIGLLMIMVSSNKQHSHFKMFR